MRGPTATRAALSSLERLSRVDGRHEKLRAPIRGIRRRNHKYNTPAPARARGAGKNAPGLDKKLFRRTRSGKLNPNTHQKFTFCARLQAAAGLALYICPGRPGAAS